MLAVVLLISVVTIFCSFGRSENWPKLTCDMLIHLRCLYLMISRVPFYASAFDKCAWITLRINQQFGRPSITKVFVKSRPNPRFCFLASLFALNCNTVLHWVRKISPRSVFSSTSVVCAMILTTAALVIINNDSSNPLIEPMWMNFCFWLVSSLSILDVLCLPSHFVIFWIVLRSGTPNRRITLLS